MPQTDFLKRLNKELNFSAAAADPFSKAKKELDNIADSIQQKLNEDLADTPILIEIEPGFKATMGQQLKVILRIPDKGFRDSLFRAYVPDSGYPMQLDLYGEEPVVCDDRDSLEGEVLKFLTRVRDRLSSYRDYARKS